MSKNFVNWAILGPGHIGHAFASNFPEMENGKLLAVAGRDAAKARAFADQYGIERAYDVAGLLADDDIDIVYIGTPNGAHYGNIKDCLLAGKHVLCEKTITMTLAQLEECYAIAEEKGLILAEALTSIYLPLMAFLKEKIDRGDYGKLHFVTVTCGSCKELDPNNRFWNLAKGGGALFDTGCYAFGVANYFMHGELTDIQSMGTMYETGVDLKSATIMRNDHDEYATVMLGFRSMTDKLAVIACEDAMIEIDGFIRPFSAKVKFLLEKGREEVYEFPRTGGFELEALALTRDVLDGKTDCTLCPKDVTVKNLQVMDEVRHQMGFVFDIEK